MSDMNEKIRKLLALANHPGTGAAESAAAAAMAADLALKYNIELSQINKMASNAQAKNFARGNPTVEVHGIHRTALINLARGIADLYGCQFLIYKVKSSRASIGFVGQDHNVAMADTWLDYLWAACRNTNSVYNKGQTYATTIDARRANISFRLHFAMEVRNRLAEKLASMRRGETAGTGTALMVVNWFETEKKEVQLWMDANLRLGKASTTRKREIDYNAAMAGYRAGQTTGLDDQIGASSNPARRRIS